MQAAAGRGYGPLCDRRIRFLSHARDAGLARSKPPTRNIVPPGAFIPGEGAGAFAIARESSIDRWGGESFALIRGVGVALETHTIKTEAVCVGEGLTKCVRTALTSLRPPGEIVDGIVCDINGERYRSEEWGFALIRLPEALADPTGYDAPASFWGDVGAASGPLFVVIAALAAKRGWAKGTRYLIWNSSEGGQRAAALLQLPPPAEGNAS